MTTASNTALVRTTLCGGLLVRLVKVLLPKFPHPISWVDVSAFHNPLWKTYGTVFNLSPVLESRFLTTPDKENGLIPLIYANAGIAIWYTPMSSASIRSLTWYFSWCATSVGRVASLQASMLHLATSSSVLPDWTIFSNNFLQAMESIKLAAMD